MDKAAALDTIARFRKAIESKGINVSKLILYGSYARGDFREPGKKRHRPDPHFRRLQWS